MNIKTNSSQRAQGQLPSRVQSSTYYVALKTTTTALSVSKAPWEARAIRTGLTAFRQIRSMLLAFRVVHRPKLLPTCRIVLLPENVLPEPGNLFLEAVCCILSSLLNDFVGSTPTDIDCHRLL